MMCAFLSSERGAVTSDWLVLSAGIVLLGMFVTYAVMFDSGGYLMAEFDQMNQQEHEASATDFAGLGSETTAGAGVDGSRSLTE